MIRCCITNRLALGGEAQLLDAIARNIAAGVEWIQIREKDLPARDLSGLLRRALALPRPAGTKILLNTRVDVALASGAAGAHLPAGSMAPRIWRSIAPPGFLIGVSCHTVEEVRQGETDGADYAIFGPVFEPLSKTSDLAPRGLAALAEAVRAANIPVLALGGITRDRVPACLETGAAGVAGISLFQSW